MIDDAQLIYDYLQTKLAYLNMEIKRCMEDRSDDEAYALGRARIEIQHVINFIVDNCDVKESHERD